MVRMVENGEVVKMSKRTGNAVTIRDLIDDIGVDATRYFFVAKAANTPFDFDLGLAKSQSNENPVFYVQYAHARICSILRNVAEYDCEPELDKLRDETELALMKRLTDYSKEITNAAEEYDPSKITKYAFEIASLFHSFYNACRVKNDDDHGLTNARLMLVKSCGHVLKSVLGVLGVSAPESM